MDECLIASCVFLKNKFAVLVFVPVLDWDVTKTMNGEWGMGNGEWGMGNGEWGMGNEK